MSSRIKIDVPLNRVEGDLEVRAEVEDGIVTDAWCSGTMYRGFERIMIGRGPLDGLVITPRICGICSTGHLNAAALALDMITHTEVPPDAVRVRNLTLMSEHIQSDVRQTFLMYAVDFTNPRHKDQPLFEEAVQRYRPFEGEAQLEVIRETKHVLEIIAILGGQWPHSSFMVPGGVTAVPGRSDLLQCRQLLDIYRRWYERRVLGCSLDRWAAVGTRAELDAWLDESPAHQQGELGFFVRYARAIGLDATGQGCDAFLSYGALPLPEGTGHAVPWDQPRLVPAGFARGTDVSAFDQRLVAEDVSHSWYVDQEASLHPSEGITEPYATGAEGQKYSWGKAPRYSDLPAETGPLAEAIMARDPLLCELARDGATAFSRQLARLVRPARVMPVMETWLLEISENGSFYRPPGAPPEGVGFGLTHASRGALGHWVDIADGQIRRYQIITPTAWNAAPRDAAGVRGPMEQALVGTAVQDPDDPIELGHVVRSFDPCLVCTVHAIVNEDRGGRPAGGSAS